MKCLINCSAVIVFTVDMFLCRAMYISNPYLSQLHMEFVKAFQIWEKIYVAFEPLVSHIHHSEVCHNSEVHIDEECELCNKKKTIGEYSYSSREGASLKSRCYMEYQQFRPLIA